MIFPEGEVVHTVGVVTGTVVGGTYAVVGTTVVTGGALGARVVVVMFGGGVVVADATVVVFVVEGEVAVPLRAGVCVLVATVVDAVVFCVIAFRPCVPGAFAPDPLDVTLCDPDTV